MANRFRTSATPGRAPQSRKLVAGQAVDGWLVTVENTVAQSGSIDSTPLRSQTIPYGRSARSLSSVRWIRGAVSTVIEPVRCTIKHPSRMEWRISIRSSPAFGNPRPDRQGTPRRSGFLSDRHAPPDRQGR
jgi:hypothetical protein